jgi:hypothetical protein
MSELFKLEFYVPESHLERVKQAVFATGAGKVGDYECCAWQTLGQGQYRPLAGSQPYQGQVDALEKAQEYKVELVCKAELIRDAVAALKAAHPYEEVAFSVIRTESL